MLKSERLILIRASLMKKVVICQHRLLHYRLALFELLREACAKRGIELNLVHGQASRRELTKKDEGVLPWAHKVENQFLELGERDLLWQPLPAELADADLIIIMQENRILSNYPLLVKRMLGRQKLAYWGHGVNFQSEHPNGLRERWKRIVLTRVDWWFAYTQTTVRILENAGYPKQRITCLNNSIDTEGFQRDLAAITETDLSEQLRMLGAESGSRIGLFCGSLYPDKRLEYMMEAADQIHAQVPDFQLVVVGDGPSAGDILAAAESRPWIKYMGARRGVEKAVLFRLATVLFNPGAVGLHVLDSFCSGIPIATTSEARHGPEFAYLKDGQNSIIARGDPSSYARAIIKLLSDSKVHARLCFNAKQNASQYSLRNMVENFVEGIDRCLALKD